MERLFVFRCLLVLCLVLFAIGSNAQGRSNSTLPVMFDNVRISLKNGGVLVEWSNLTERELIDYVIERSSDAKNFVEVSRFKPKSNENEPMSYSGVDPSPYNGLNYYRIRVNEISGKIIYSIMLKIETSKETSELGIYPNPAISGQITWSVANLPAGKYDLSIINMNGIPVYRETIKIQGKAITETTDLPPAIPAGVYRLSLQGDGVERGRTFIVQ